jgi:hypothetical protein
MPILLLPLLLLEPLEPLLLPFPFPLPLPLPLLSLLGLGAEGPPEDTTFAATVGAVAVAVVEGALLLRERSRTRRLVPGPLSGPAQSPRI